MLTAAEIKQRLKQSNISEVSRETGILYASLHRLATIKESSPKLDIAEKLTLYFEKIDKVAEYKKKLLSDFTK